MDSKLYTNRSAEHNKTFFRSFNFPSWEPDGINSSIDGVDKWIIEITSCEDR